MRPRALLEKSPIFLPPAPFRRLRIAGPSGYPGLEKVHGYRVCRRLKLRFPQVEPCRLFDPSNPIVAELNRRMTAALVEYAMHETPLFRYLKAKASVNAKKKSETAEAVRTG